jgi:hypothetical protein
MSFDANSFNQKMTKLGLKAVRGQVDLKGLQAVRINRSDDIAARDWCEVKFKDNWIWSAPIQTDYTIFYFQTTQDALLFKLSFNTA